MLQASGKLPESSQPVRGWDFDHGRDLDGIMGAMLHSGLQASALGEAVVEVNRTVSNKFAVGTGSALLCGPRVALEGAGPSPLPMWEVHPCQAAPLCTADALASQRGALSSRGRPCIRRT